LPEDGWAYAPMGSMLACLGGARVVCHACGEQLTAISADHLRRYDLDLTGYRERFGLNRKRSLLAPALAALRREEGKRRWVSNTGVRDDLAVGQQMVRTGVLYVLGAAARPVGTRSGASRPVRTGGAPCPGRVMATAPDRE
jgi:hypothetical protein